MTKTRGYALIDRQTGKVVWAGLDRPEYHQTTKIWSYGPLEDDFTMNAKLTRILITPERKKK